jgi:hypothetical protein
VKKVKKWTRGQGDFELETLETGKDATATPLLLPFELRLGVDELHNRGSDQLTHYLVYSTTVLVYIYERF